MARASQKKASRKIDPARLAGIRGTPGPVVRDFTAGSDAERPTGYEGQAFGSRRTWLVAAVVNLGILMAVALGVLVGPPLLGCRQQAEVGFFGGETFSGCVTEATSRRVGRLESQLSMIVRGSGH